MYRALYRKWRPQTFDDVYGQPHVTRTLKNELATGRISHAYLFTGSRGTGNTSCAKILAKAVNCLHPADGNPCNECEICKSIDNGSILDVIEIDAASNNGVDNIRDLREEANFLPASAKYRVYIIDEVHMLSTGAFNALLKTLEEPPAHVIFILATTDLQKLPATILSRCQRFDFKRISADEIVRRLKVVAEGEGVTINDEAASLIANLAEGGMRDALSIMDRCLSVTENIDENTVSDVSGIANTSYMFRFSDCIARRDYTSVLGLVDELYNGFCDVDRICSRLADHFRNLMVALSVHNCKDLIICSENELELYRAEAKKFKLGKILECIDIIGETSKTLKSAADKRIIFEASVIKMCSSGSGSAVIPSDFEERISALEEKINSILQDAAVQPVQAAPVKPEISAAPSEEKIKDEASAGDKPEENAAPAPQTNAEEVPQPASKQEERAPKPINPPVVTERPAQAEGEKGEPEVPVLSDFSEGPFTDWPEIVERIGTKDIVFYGLLSDTSAFVKDGKLVIKTANPALYDFIVKDAERAHYKELKSAILNITGKDIKLVINTVGERDDDKKDDSPLAQIKEKIRNFKSEEGE
ncbi:MAG: DNA polymerase III subunit gamma/tau [Clostridia bacterium]|nr:DNA polymerase III subunit gamma/tau [Clostridia bacterium]